MRTVFEAVKAILLIYLKSPIVSAFSADDSPALKPQVGHDRMRKCFFLFSLSFIVGCSGGSVSVQPHGPDPARPASYTVQQMEAIHDPEALTQFINSLHAGRGDLLDWGGFWRALQESHVQTRLSPAQQDRLLSLQSRSCSQRFFYPYIDYIIHTHTGLEHLLPPKRSCYLGMTPGQLHRVIQLIYPANERPIRFSPENTLALIRFETQRYVSADWPGFFIRADRELQQLSDRFVQVEDASSMQSLVELYRIHDVRIPFADRLRSFILENVDFRARWFNSTRQGDVLRETVALFSQPSFVPRTVTTETARNLVITLNNLPLDRSVHAAPLWARFAEENRLVTALLPRLDGRSQIEIRELLLRRYTTEFRARSGAALNDLLWRMSQDSHSPILSTLALWTLTSVLPTGPLDMPSLQDSIAAIDLDELADLSLKMMAYHIKIRFARSLEDAASLRQELCSVWERSGVPTQRIADGELLLTLEKGMSGGCYRLEALEKNAKALALRSSDTLKMSIGTVLIAPDRNLEFEAKDVQLGVIDLSAEKQHAPLPEEATPNDYHAMGFPMLVGFRVSEPDRMLFKGAHFLLIHTRYRESKNGPKAKAMASQGFPGGNLLIKSVDTPRVSFVSVGGLGQKGAPPVPGGRNDISRIDVKALKSWLADREVIDTRGTNLSAPFHLHLRPTIGHVEALLAKAPRDGKGAIETVALRAYPDFLDAATRERLLSVCREHVQGFRAQDLPECLRSVLIPLALRQISEELENLRERDRASAFRRADADAEYEILGGLLGPFNRSGPRGSPGTVQIQRVVSGQRR